MQSSIPAICRSFLGTGADTMPVPRGAGIRRTQIEPHLPVTLQGTVWGFPILLPQNPLLTGTMESLARMMAPRMAVATSLLHLTPSPQVSSPGQTSGPWLALLQLRRELRMPMKIATQTTVLSQMLVFRSNGDAKTVAPHLTRLTMWGYHQVCSTMMGSWTSLPQNLALTKTRL